MVKKTADNRLDVKTVVQHQFYKLDHSFTLISEVAVYQSQPKD